jgi:hypothetical protein
MDYKKENLKSAFWGFSNNSDYPVWTPEKGYKTKSIKSLVARIILAPLSLATLIFSIPDRSKTYLADTNFPSPVEEVHAADVSSPRPDEKRYVVQTNPKEIISQPKRENAYRNIIRADMLENTGTVFEGTNILKYTEKGIKVPGNEYGILIDGKDFLPDENLYIQIPENLRGKKARFTKLNLSKVDNPEGKYLASFKAKIRTDNSQETQSFANSYVPKTLEEKSLDNQINSAKINLESLCDTIPQAEIDTAKMYSSIIETYALKKRPSNDLSMKVVDRLKEGYKIKSNELNKDGYIRSDTNIVTNILYSGGKSFTERVVELKQQSLSNKDIAKTMRKETELYVEGKGMNINEKQISDSLKTRGWVSATEYKKRLQEYISKPHVTVYGN